MVLLEDAIAVVVAVYDAQGRPVDGIPVTFRVEPAQAIHAPIVPQPAVTQKGRVEVVLHPAEVGLVRITAVVEQTAQTVIIAVVRREIPAGA